MEVTEGSIWAVPETQGVRQKATRLLEYRETAVKSHTINYGITNSQTITDFSLGILYKKTSPSQKEKGLRAQEIHKSWDCSL